ncbi:kelch repeat protein [Diaporthe amygdali]|uniref:kelch repeat protein n=1 Tax=Phomopsis amygdali TaxID=1214568 RepID=UPI0022FF0826|nr:kelch repeat protein [Diaporthe amygdali]KAJ0115552.1 kelch repeat protein [Diaporthe amygdali]
MTKLTATWTQLTQNSTEASTLDAPPEAPTARVGSASAVIKDSLYLFSGRGGIAMAPVEENGAIWRYTPSHSSWKLLKPVDPEKPYPAGRSYHAMTSNGSDLLFVHAGCPEKGRLQDLWSFSLVSQTWNELPSAPEPSRGGTSIAYSGGKLYRMNGFDGTTEQGGLLDTYDLATNKWSSFAFNPDGKSGPGPRSVSTLVAVTIKGKIYLVTMFGECDPSSLGHAGAGKMLSDVWAFDVAGQDWVKVEASGGSPAPRGWFAADVAQAGGEDSVIVHGGLAEDNSRLGDVWRLDFT